MQRRAIMDSSVSGDPGPNIDEISDLLNGRFGLCLLKHYDVDRERLTAIQESGSMFAHVEAVRPVPCAERHLILRNTLEALSAVRRRSCL